MDRTESADGLADAEKELYETDVSRPRRKRWVPIAGAAALLVGGSALLLNSDAGSQLLQHIPGAASLIMNEKVVRTAVLGRVMPQNYGEGVLALAFDFSKRKYVNFKHYSPGRVKDGDLILLRVNYVRPAITYSRIILEGKSRQGLMLSEQMWRGLDRVTTKIMVNSFIERVW